MPDNAGTGLAASLSWPLAEHMIIGEIVTYPPQQPGPYGQQPDPYGQNPYGQQQPYGQDQYGQPAWGGGGYTGPPKKSKSGLIAALVIVGILVLGGGGVGIYFLAKGDDTDGNNGGTAGPVDSNNPNAVAERLASLYETVINTDLAEFDKKAFEQVLCSSDYGDLTKDFDNTRKLRESRGRQPTKRAPDQRVDVAVKDFEADTDSGSFKLTLNDPTSDGTASKPKDLTLRKTDGRWEVCGLYKKTSPTSRATRPSR
jgi:hypothetical protein